MLVEVYEYKGSELDDRTYIFYENYLRLLYRQRMLQYAIDMTINIIKYRSEIMNYFEFYGILHITTDIKMVLIFQKVLKNDAIIIKRL